MKLTNEESPVLAALLEMIERNRKLLTSEMLDFLRRTRPEGPVTIPAPEDERQFYLGQRIHQFLRVAMLQIRRADQVGSFPCQRFNMSSVPLTLDLRISAAMGAVCGGLFFLELLLEEIPDQKIPGSSFLQGDLLEEIRKATAGTQQPTNLDPPDETRH